MDRISACLAAHYAATFDRHGPTAKGVDWGDENSARLRYDKMLSVIPSGFLDNSPGASLLDVGCGFGGLGLYAKELELPIKYTGIDIVENMIDFGRSNLSDAEFICGDFNKSAYIKKFDFVICNGILTQKLTSSIQDMDRYSRSLIRRMFKACRIGIAFNVMTSYVNFTVNNLFYKSPVEMIAFVSSEISPKFRLDHAYPLYEYTVYAYRPDFSDI